MSSRNNQSKYTYHKDRSRRSSYDSSTPRKKSKPDFFKMRKQIRERSNSLLREMKIKNISNGIGLYQKIYEKPKDKFFDGYQWIKVSESDKIDILKPGNSVIISNIPFHVKINLNDFIDFICKHMKEQNVISKDEKNSNTVKALEFNESNNSAIMVLSSPEIAKRMILLDGVKLLGYTLRLSPYIETKLEENTFKGQVSMANSADISAKSTAVALSALEALLNSNSNKSEESETCGSSQEISKVYQSSSLMLLNNTKFNIIPSEVIKVMNFCGEEVRTMPKDKYIDLKNKIKKEFEKFGKIKLMKIISSKKLCQIGVELGNVFIEYESIEASSSANQFYSSHDLKVKTAFIDKDVLYKEILKE